MYMVSRVMRGYLSGGGQLRARHFHPYMVVLNTGIIMGHRHNYSCFGLG